MSNSENRGEDLSFLPVHFHHAVWTTDPSSNSSPNVSPCPPSAWQQQSMYGHGSLHAQVSRWQEPHAPHVPLLGQGCWWGPALQGWMSKAADFCKRWPWKAFPSRHPIWKFPRYSQQPPDADMCFTIALQYYWCWWKGKFLLSWAVVWCSQQASAPFFNSRLLEILFLPIQIWKQKGPL